MGMSRAAGIEPNGGAFAEWLRIVRARAGERAGRRAITAEAGVIGVVSVNIGRSCAANRHHDVVKNVDRICRQNFYERSPPSVTLERKLSVPLLPGA